MRPGLGLGLSYDPVIHGLERDTAVVMDFPFVRGILPYVGKVSSVNCPSGTSTIDYLGRQITGKPHQAMIRGGRLNENKFKFTEDFTNPVWTKLAVTATKSTILETATTALHGVSQASIDASSYGVQHIRAKSIGGRLLQIRGGVSVNDYVNFDLVNGVVGTVGSGASGVGMVLESDGFYWCTVAFANSTVGFFNVVTDSASAWGESYAGDITKGLEIKKACLNDTTGEPSPEKPNEYLSAGVPVGGDKVPSTAFDDWADSSTPDSWTTFPSDASNYAVEGSSGGYRLVSDGTSTGTSLTDPGVNSNEDYLITYEYSDKTTGSLGLWDGATSTNFTAAVGVRTSFVANLTAIQLKRWSGVTDCTLSYFNVQSLSHGLGVDGVSSEIFDKSHITVVDGVVYESDTKVSLNTVDGLQGMPGSTNKNTNFNYNPDAALTNIAIYESGGSGGIVTRVLKVAELAAAGLTNRCPSGYVIHIDNTLGTGRLAILPGGDTGNTNTHTGSAIVLGDGHIHLEGNYATNKTVFSTIGFKRKTNTGVTTLTTQGLQVGCEAGEECFVVANQLEELPFATDTILVDGVSRSRDEPKYAFIWTGGKRNFKVEFDYLHQGFDSVDFRFLFAVGSATDRIYAFIDTGTGKLIFRIVINSVGYGIYSNAALTAGQSYKLEFIYKNGMSMVIDTVTQTDTDVIDTDVGLTGSELFYLMADYNGAGQPYGCVLNEKVTNL